MSPESKVNVLLVDDHPQNLLALEAILDCLDQNLVKAHSGAEALRCLLNQDFAVILLDVQMPGMDGFETARLIRQRERSLHTPIIFLTAFSTSDTLVFKGYSLGAVDYLFKPLQPEILKSKVAVFVDLFKKTAEIKRQATQLAAINAELRKSEEQFRSLSACSPVGIFMTDIAGRCTYTNSRCQATDNFKLEESLIEGWSRSVHPEDRDWVLADWSARTLKGQEYSNEFRLLAPEGSVHWVHVRSSPMLSEQGQVIGQVGTVEDITERKQAEAAHTQFIREQAARQEAEAANRMKDEFLATLSHELRTPLNSILGWARLLRTKKFDEKTTARALETIERNAKSQAQLIEDILDVSRIIRGKLRLHLVPVNLVSVIEAAIDSVRLAAEAKAIDFRFLIFDFGLENMSENPESIESDKQPGNSKFLVSGDPERLQQVIWNLLSNGIKFTPAGGKVEVRLSVSCSNEQQTTNNYVQIQVSDTGIGIGKDFLPYVFERFRQADSTTTRSHSGLGLGLAIVRHLVELHRGTVHVQSDGEGTGATFIVQLPLFKDEGGRIKDELIPLLLNPHPSPETPISTESTPSPLILEDLRVLIVDSDTDTHDFLTTVLEQHGARVTAVASVSEAMAALQQLTPDVMIGDIGMLEQDAYELLRQVRALEAERGEKITAIAMTPAYASNEELKLAAGFQMHLPKPVESTELIAALAQFAGQDCRL
ncbi:response regulator [Chroococcidiopsis sp. CCMEE 29]|uniref:response regulator n=1 Tax=Chroococcidiopsis sp. CCMEE 29 TaxID=155894 RepID=UPI002021A50B|nr:response regulator [Chroococcidiopsis sp. CCMEE 29]